jgi:hypothetical protein
MKIENRIEKAISLYGNNSTENLNDFNFFNCSREELISSKKHYEYISGRDNSIPENEVELYIKILGKEKIKSYILEDLKNIDNLNYYFRRNLENLDFTISDLINNRQYLPELLDYDNSYRFYSLLSNSLKENNFDEVVLFLLEYIFINNDYWQTYYTFYDTFLSKNPDLFKRNKDILLENLIQSINSQNILNIFSLIICNIELDLSTVKEIYNLINLYDLSLPKFIYDSFDNSRSLEYDKRNNNPLKNNLTLFYDYYLSLDRDKNIIKYSDHIFYDNHIVNQIFIEKLKEIYTKEYIIENPNSLKNNKILNMLINNKILNTDIYNLLLENNIENVFTVGYSYRFHDNYKFIKIKIYEVLDIYVNNKYYINSFKSETMYSILNNTLNKFSKIELVSILEKYFIPIFDYFTEIEKKERENRVYSDELLYDDRVDVEEYKNDFYNSKNDFIFLVECFIINILNIKQQYELITKYDYKLIDVIKKPKTSLFLKLASFDNNYFMRYLFLLKLNNYENISYYRKEQRKTKSKSLKHSGDAMLVAKSC